MGEDLNTENTEINTNGDSNVEGQGDADNGESLMTGNPESGETPLKENAEPKEGEEPSKDNPKEEDKPTEGAPETYADFKTEEGLKFEKPMLDKFSATAKELNLTQDQAQKMLDLASEHVKDLAKKGGENFTNLRTQWVNDLKSDKEFGGEKFNETVEHARRAVEKYGSPELKKFLGQGIGDNTELVKAFAKIGKDMGEAGKVINGDPAITDKSAAEILYDNS